MGADDGKSVGQSLALKARVIALIVVVGSLCLLGVLTAVIFGRMPGDNAADSRGQSGYLIYSTGVTSGGNSVDVYQ